MRRAWALKLTLGLVVTALCLGWLARELDLARVAASLGAAEPMPLAAAFGLALLLPFWRGARLAALLPPARRPGGGVLTALVAEVLLWGFMLPFKLGELSFPWLLHRRCGLPLVEATGLFLFVRLVDLAAIAGLLVIAAGLLGLVGTSPKALVVVAGVAVMLAPLAVGGPARRLRAWLPPTARRLGALLDGAAHARGPAAQSRLVLTTLAIWGSHALIAAAALVAVGEAVEPATALLASSAGNLAFALPVNGVLGLGPQQAAFAAAATRGGVGWETAAAAAIATYVVVVGSATLAGVAARLTLAKRSPA